MALVNPDHLYEYLRNIADVACECLEDTPLGRPTDCYIVHNQPPDDCCDYLAVWAEFIRPSVGFSDAQYITGGKLWDRCQNVGAVMDVGIRLVRPCYPTLIDNPFNPFPPTPETEAASMNLLIDAWVLRCCVLQAASDGAFFPLGSDCLEIAWGDMLPHGPKGGCAGWTWHLVVELDNCC